MHSDPIVFTIFLIFTGAALFATVALFARQALPVAYIALGVLIGPSGIGLVEDSDVIRQVADIGIMFLLFLLGLNLLPQKLIKLVQETTLVTGVSSLLFAGTGVGLGLFLGFTWIECLIIGAALMFSSTIIGIKLLPTTVLHHKHTGEIITSILLLQDVIAIVILLALQAHGRGDMKALEFAFVALSLPGLVLFAYLLERFVLIKLIARFDRIQEYIFLLAVGWCLGMAELAALLGLSHEIGAFIAGVALAASPIAAFISENLKPLRDFFLVIFFFTLGASFDMEILAAVILPAALLAAIALTMKPLVFGWLLKFSGEAAERSMEIGFRLGQISEFSLLIAVLALQLGVIGSQASYLIQVATLLTFIASSYIIVLRYPTPVAVSDRLRRD
ncbi:MAG: cation:proton antiporter [Gammaproteobacteria bacterium]